jgi:NAD(P)H dehydrogenase (quinone)
MIIPIFYVSGHPNGHCAAILTETVKQLSEKNIPHIVIDLHKEKFNPVLEFDGPNSIDDALVTKYKKIISTTNKMIFIYPVWWDTMPALMKGFFDRVFSAKFAFRYIKYPIIPFAIPKGLLWGKKAVVFTTTGAEKWQSLLFMFNRFKWIIKFDILLFCGVRSRVYQLGNSILFSENKKPRIQKIVSSGLKYLR